jgi:hypothetical protein
MSIEGDFRNATPTIWREMYRARKTSKIVIVYLWTLFRAEFVGMTTANLDFRFHAPTVQ